MDRSLAPPAGPGTNQLSLSLRQLYAPDHSLLFGTPMVAMILKHFYQIVQHTFTRLLFVFFHDDLYISFLCNQKKESATAVPCDQAATQGELGVDKAHKIHTCSLSKTNK